MAVTDEMVCFSLYSASRATTQAYRALLAPWGLTYPQYLVLAILWHEGEQSIRSLGDAMQLDSGTLSPLVRRLEQAGFLRKQRSTDDERVVMVQLTPEGQALRADLAKIPAEVAGFSGIHDDEHRRRLIGELRELTRLLQAATPAPAGIASRARGSE